MRSIFETVSEIIFSVYSVNKQFALKSGEFFEKYKYGYGFESIQKSTSAVVMLVSFVNDYVEGIARGLEFFSDLVFALGVEGNSEIFSQRRKLKELVQQEKIDLGFLKFQVRTTAEFTFPRLEDATVRILEKLDQLKETSYILESDILNTFIKEVENQKNGWKKLRSKIGRGFENVENGNDVSTCVNEITGVIEEFLEFGANFEKLARYLNFNLGDRLEFSTENIGKILKISKKLGNDLSTLAHHRLKATEYFEKSLSKILTLLWGNENTARLKFQSFIRSEVTSDELVPENFTLEDLAFSLMQARNDYLLAKKAHERMEENIDAMKKAAEYLNSPVLKEQYEMVMKEIEIVKKWWPKYNQNLIEAQNLLHKNNKDFVNRQLEE